MLDHRAGYDDLDEREVTLYQRSKGNSDSSNQALFRKSAPKIARAYIYPHELPSKDYFWGGYVSLVVSPDEWIVENEDPKLISTPLTSESSFEKGDQK